MKIRTLYYYYPEIQKELIRFYSKIFVSSDIIYDVDSKITVIKDKLYEYYPDLLNEINDLFEDLVLSSILKELGIENAIKWSVAMIKLSLID